MAKKNSLQDSSLFSTEISFNAVDNSYRLKDIHKIRSWITSVILQEKKKPGVISFNFCSDEALLGINKQHLNHDYYTDIITFDFCEHDNISGDIYISIDRVKENARTFNLTISQELNRVLIHGVLHLCGYKDKSSKQQQQMRGKEDYYLSLLPNSSFHVEH